MVDILHKDVSLGDMHTPLGFNRDDGFDWTLRLLNIKTATDFVYNISTSDGDNVFQVNLGTDVIPGFMQFSNSTDGFEFKIAGQGQLSYEGHALVLADGTTGIANNTDDTGMFVQLSSTNWAGLIYKLDSDEWEFGNITADPRLPPFNVTSYSSVHTLNVGLENQALLGSGSRRVFTSDGELYWRDDAANNVRLTLSGAVDASGMANDLQGAYDDGNTIAVITTDGPVDVIHSSANSSTGAIQVTYASTDFTGAANGIVVDLDVGGATYSSGSNIHGIRLLGQGAEPSNANTIGMRISGFDEGVVVNDSSRFSGSFLADGTSIDLAPSANYTLAMGTGTAITTMAESSPNAFRIDSSDGDIWFRANTSDGEIELGNATDDPTLIWSGAGPWNVAGSIGTSGQVLISNSDASPSWTSMGTVTLQGAYDGGETITITGTDGPVDLVAGSGQSTMTFTGSSSTTAISVDGNYTTGISTASAFSQTGGTFSFSGTAFDLNPTGNFTLDTAGTNTATITVVDDLDNAFLLQQGANSYFALNTSDGAENISLGNTTTNPDITQLGTGQVLFSGNVNATLGLDVTGNDLTVGGQDLNVTVGNILLSDGNFTLSNGTTFLSSAGTFDVNASTAYTLDMGSSADATITIANSRNNAWVIRQGTSNYLRANTSDNRIHLGNATDNTQITQVGTGQVTFPGNIDAGNGVDISGGPLTLLGQTVSLDITDNTADAFLVERGTDSYIAIDTSDTTPTITLGNATTNPDLVWPGAGEWDVGGSVGTASQVITANPGASPSWQTLSATITQQTDVDSGTVNTSGLTYITASTISVAVTGTYLCIFEGTMIGSANSTEAKIAIALNSIIPTGGSERSIHTDNGGGGTAFVTTSIFAATDTQTINGIFARDAGGGSVTIQPRRLTIIRII